MSKIILDLCGGTGAWSKPYKDAGYDVRLITWPDYDVRNFVPPKDVYGILAAPPCTMFSYARTRAKTPRDLKEGMEIVKACLEIIYQAQYEVGKRRVTTLKFWALENPYAMLKHFLGKPALIFNPYDYGDRYQKNTAIWGYFNIPKKKPINLTEEEKIKFSKHTKKLPMLPKEYKNFACLDRRAARRAITPPGFALAFFKANQ